MLLCALCVYLLCACAAPSVMNATNVEVVWNDFEQTASGLLWNELFRVPLPKDRYSTVLKGLSAMGKGEPTQCGFGNIDLLVYQNEKVTRYCIAGDGDPEVRIGGPENANKQYHVCDEEIFYAMKTAIVDTLLETHHPLLRSSEEYLQILRKTKPT